MSRRRAAEKRAILPDAKFGDPVITKFINCLMMQGKKSAAERIVYSALDTIGQRSNEVGSFTSRQRDAVQEAGCFEVVCCQFGLLGEHVHRVDATVHPVGSRGQVNRRIAV